MKTMTKKVVGPNSKSVTLPFIGRSLKSMGMDATLNGDAYYVDLGFNSNLVIGYRRGKISVAVAMPTDKEEIEEHFVIAIASAVMVRTMLTKVFLVPEGDEMIMWFSVESICKVRGEFEVIFDALYKILMKSVRTFVEIRESVTEDMQALSIASLMLGQSENQKPS